MAGLLALLPSGFLEASGTASAANTPMVLSDHQASVVREATARLIPGPTDDPSERGHPGAREANVTRYIITMLGALSYRPAAIFAGGPFSNRGGNATDDMATFIGLTPAQAHGWSKRLTDLREQYATGIAELDRLADGDFVGASAETKDDILAKDPKGFMSLLFTHAIEGMYSAPEYGGNADLVGWHGIDFPGDRLPDRLHGPAGVRFRWSRCLRSLRRGAAGPRLAPIQLMGRAHSSSGAVRVDRSPPWCWPRVAGMSPSSRRGPTTSTISPASTHGRSSPATS